MNPAILHQEVQAYIHEHINEDINRVILSKSPFPTITSKELAEQIESKRSAEKKLPTWYNTPGIYFPPKLSIEQSSSEETANYKSTLVKGEKLIDLTGGIGVDSYYFAKKVRSVIHCEINSQLSEIAAYNAKVLKSDTITFVNGDGLAYLKNTSQLFDTIYIDPSRRLKSQKVFLLKDCEPDVISNLDILLAKADRVIIKTSPLLDIQSGLKELKNVRSVHVISVKNDCKELVWIIERDFYEEPEIICAAINDKEIQKFSFLLSEEKLAEPDSYSLPQKYLYEPDVALLKAGCFKLITKKFDLKKLHVNTHLYTSNEVKNQFIGRKFKIIVSQNYKSFIKNNTLIKANIIVRNFPLSAAEIKKKHKLQDGGDDYLLFTTGPNGELLAIHADRI